MQITRWFRHWSIYVGGENLTNFKQKTPIYGASNYLGGVSTLFTARKCHV